MDLVEINSSQSPPVCKVMDYREYLAQQKQKAMQAQRALEEKELQELRTPQKEMRFSVQIADHDLEVKLRKVVSFVEAGCKCVREQALLHAL
jgi:translation initiation factor IF-3